MKNIARAVLRTVGLEVKRLPRTAEDPEQVYIRGGRVPWSSGYHQAKHKFISHVINDPSFLQIFLTKDNLPDRFGVGFDERCIEYPYVLAHLPPGARSILDAGSVLNYESILSHPRLSNRNLHIMTLAPENNCFWYKGISYVYTDLRCIPIQDNYYDAICCISTLEHVGLDNTLSTRNEAHRENNPEDFLVAIKELRRVLRPRGILLFSVPFGVHRNFGIFQQFDGAMLARAIAAFGGASHVSETFYRYTVDGWRLASAQECASCEYVTSIVATWQQQQVMSSPPLEPDLAAAARAVACVSLVKA